MQKAIYSVAVVTPTLLILGTVHQVARAEDAPQNIRAQQLYRSLQEAVCRNDWDRAIQAIHPLIANPDLTDPYRQAMIRFRYQLEHWRAAKSHLVQQPGCLTTRGSSSMSSPSHRRSSSLAPLQPTPGDAQWLYAALQQAVCQNDWEQAIAVLQPLIASPDISPAYRQQLVRFRYQLEAWRAAGADVDAIPGCGAIALPSVPEQLDRLAWS